MKEPPGNVRLEDIGPQEKEQNLKNGGSPKLTLKLVLVLVFIP